MISQPSPAPRPVPFGVVSSSTAYCPNCAAPYAATLPACPECPPAAVAPRTRTPLREHVLHATATLALFLILGFIGGCADPAFRLPAAVGLASSALLFVCSLALLPGGLRAHVDTGRLEIW